MKASEARIISDKVKIEKLEPILNLIKINALNGKDWCLFDNLSIIEIEGLESLGYKVEEHSENYTVTW